MMTKEEISALFQQGNKLTPLEQELAGELMEVLDIIGKLPTTADGVRVGPGDCVWSASKVDPGPHKPTLLNGGRWVVHVWISRDIEGPSWDYELVADCYSTPEAAEAAKKEADDE